VKEAYGEENPEEQGSTEKHPDERSGSQRLADRSSDAVGPDLADGGLLWVPYFEGTAVR